MSTKKIFLQTIYTHHKCLEIIPPFKSVFFYAKTERIPENQQARTFVLKT